MEKIIETIPYERVKDYDLIKAYFGDRKVCMFDIETTGLSPFKSFTYIIGVNVFEEGTWKIIQLFNDDGRSEPEMIRAFQAMIKDYDVLIEFNGDTFDIPYIQKRMSFIEEKFHIRLTDNFSSIQNFDLMKLVRPCKFSLGLPNIKQKTIEKYLGIDRVDMYNGGQLIDVYLGYLAMKDERSRSLVLRHNRDDMEGMIYLSSILALDMLKPENLSFKDISIVQIAGSERLKLVIELEFSKKFMRPVITTAEGIDMEISGSRVILKIPILVGSLKYYYGDSEKDGFSEASGYFVSTSGCTLDKVPLYKEKCKTKDSFVMLDDTFLGNHKLILEYAAKTADKVLKYRRK